MNGQWTTGEVKFLREHRSLGAPELAKTLGRTVRSVQLAAARNRISLRRPGETRGTLLDQHHRQGVRLTQVHGAIVADPQLAALAELSDSITWMKRVVTGAFITGGVAFLVWLAEQVVRWQH